MVVGVLLGCCYLKLSRNERSGGDRAWASYRHAKWDSYINKSGQEKPVEHALSPPSEDHTLSERHIIFCSCLLTISLETEWGLSPMFMFTKLDQVQPIDIKLSPK